MISWAAGFAVPFAGSPRYLMDCLDVVLTDPTWVFSSSLFLTFVLLSGASRVGEALHH